LAIKVPIEFLRFEAKLGKSQREFEKDFGRMDVGEVLRKYGNEKVMMLVKFNVNLIKTEGVEEKRLKELL
jgi:hypothetical protein